MVSKVQGSGVGGGGEHKLGVNDHQAIGYIQVASTSGQCPLKEQCRQALVMS